MKKIILFFLVFAFPLQVFACPMGDERGRPYFEIWAEDFNSKTMFYELDGHFLRRERCMQTGFFSMRDAYSFPVVSQFLSDVYGYTNNDEIDFPNNVTVFENDFFITVGLENTFGALKELAETESHNELFYNILAQRLHDCFDSEYILRARERLDEGNFTMALPHILRIEAGAVPHDVFTEIDRDRTIPIADLHDPIALQIMGLELMELNNIVAINLDRELQQMEKIPVRFQGNPFIADEDIWFAPYTIDVRESGTYAFVRNDFLFPPPPETVQEYEESEEAEKSGFNVLFVIIPGIIIVVIALIAFDFTRANRNKKLALTKKTTLSKTQPIKVNNKKRSR